MRSSTRTGSRHAAAMMAAIATVVLAVVYMTVFRNATAPPSIHALERKGEAAEQRQLLEKAQREQRQRQGEETLDRRATEAGKGK